MSTRHHGLPVLDSAGELAGFFTVQDLEHARSQALGIRQTVGDACTRELQVTYPDESIGQALRRMGARDIGRLPVVARDSPRRLLGVLRRADLVRAYDVALTRRSAVRHRAHQVRLGAIGGLEVEELVLAPGALCVGKKVSDINWPAASMIATLRRGRRIFIPHGDTLLEAGDVLAVVAEGKAREEVRLICMEKNKDAGSSPGKDKVQ
jgi:chloride channel protein, CIC family